MTDTQIKSKTALLNNVVLFAQLMERLNKRTDKLPGIGVFYGFSGLGKTESAIYGANRHRAYYIQLGESWTKKKLTEAILAQLGKSVRGSIADKVDEIIMLLRMDNRPLIVDEADYAFNKGYHEILREIYNESQTSIILLGEEMLPSKIQQHERFHNRVLEWVAAQPCNLDDAKKLAAIYAEDVKIADDLLNEIIKQSQGVARRIAVNVNRVQEYSYNEGVEHFDLKAWGDREFYTSTPPARRA